MSDEIFSIQCECGKSMKVRESSIGKKVRCPDCQAVTTIDRPQEPETIQPIEEVDEPSIPKIVVADPKKPAAKVTKPAAPTQNVEPAAIVAQPKPIADKRKATPAPTSPASELPDFSAFEVETKPFAQPVIKTAAAATTAAASFAIETATAAKSPTAPVSVEANPISAVKSNTASGDSSASSRKYPTLELVRIIYKVMGYITLVVGVLLFGLSLYSTFSAGMESLIMNLPVVFFTLCGTVIGPITMFATSEFIKLMIDIQDNTHRTSQRH
jgi:hypothetical protein